MTQVNYYSALAKMRANNLVKFGKKNGNLIGPMQPVFRKQEQNTLDLKSAALQFVHDSCIDLRHDGDITTEEEETAKLQGVSTKKGDIPYNMQMDLDRMTLANAIDRFIDSGVAEDAFDIYFCFLEMFVGSYGKSGNIIELLSEFENNGSSLLMKHRDHYSHSAYVFILGLAIYETNRNFKNEYNKFYGLIDEKLAAHHFLEFWGLTSLFHDIGYPFELPFEQVASYFEVQGIERNSDFIPYLAYQNIGEYIALDENSQEIFKRLYGKNFSNTNELFTFNIAQKNVIGEVYYPDNPARKDENVENTSADKILHGILEDKPQKPKEFGSFMDHAFFSATVLAKQLISVLSSEEFTTTHIDSLTAILLHNSLFKFGVTNYKKVDKPFKIEYHPLAYILMYCDELQCWDRTSYGRNSRTELHPFDAKFTFKNDGIQVTYYYDENEGKKIINFWKNHDFYLRNKENDKALKEPKLKAYSSMVLDKSFKSDIERIIDTSNIKLTVDTEIREVENRGKHTYLSESNFLHLYNFAVALNAQYNNSKENDEVMRAKFEEMSLEYMISNVLQAKKFAEHLDEFGYFYTDRPVAYDMVDSFSDKELIVLGKKEHQRWEKEKNTMCWIPAGQMEKECREDKSVREQTRMHYDFGMEFEKLDTETQAKDMKPLNTMMKKLKEYDGLRIYKLR